MINGKVVEVRTQADGSVEARDLRRAAGLKDDRQLILQLPDGSNRVINPGEKLQVSPDQYFRDIPNHTRGGWRDFFLFFRPRSRQPLSRRCPPSILDAHLEELDGLFNLWLDESCRFVIIRGVKLPPGFNRRYVDVLLELAPDYPMSPPGLGNSRVFLSAGLRYRRRRLSEYREQVHPSLPTPGFGPWAWLCYENIQWSPRNDNLVTFIEMLRGDLTNPETIA